MRIAELYRSVQGEGALTGVESVFVRTSGCNLRCWFCDTPYASWKPEGDVWTLDDVFERVVRLGGKHVIITGGEPMLLAELGPLTRRLSKSGRHITIETAGTVLQDVVCDLMSISPKLAGSGPKPNTAPDWEQRHEVARQAPEVVRTLMSRYEYQLKFVIDSANDVTAAEEYVRQFSPLDRSRVWFMPQGVDRAELVERETWLAPYCREHGWRYCPRRHIEWFGPGRGV